MLERLMLKPLHQGQETGRTFRRDSGRGVLDASLASEWTVRGGQGDNRPLVLVIWR